MEIDDGQNVPLRIAHIINPVKIGPDSDLYRAQPVTFESMRRARKNIRSDVSVSFYYTCYKEDLEAAPRDFQDAGLLERSVLDLRDFTVPRKLPLLVDIVNKLYFASDAEYLIYTNVDIALMPYFYDSVAGFIEDGNDALVINRRTIPGEFSDPSELWRMYLAAGETHPGFDCFVFRRSMVPRFCLGEVCVGVHLVGRVFLWNLIAFSKSLRVIEDGHLTFHLGDDRISQKKIYRDYLEHNGMKALDVLEQLDKQAALCKLLHESGRERLLSTGFAKLATEEDSQELPPAPIFVHAMFRTGSTYVFGKLRKDKTNVCFYEPLHEALAGFSRSNIEEQKKRHSVSRYHSVALDEWYFKELEPLLPDQGCGIKGFRREFSYTQYTENRENSQLKFYVDTLLDLAWPLTPVLQMNRSSLRQEWFAREYSRGFHVYLYRDPRDQFESMMKFCRMSGSGSFLGQILCIAGKNRESRLMKALSDRVPLFDLDVPLHQHAAYNSIFDFYSTEDCYRIFYHIWLTSLVEAARNCKLLIDINRLSNDEIYRERIHYKFLLYDTYVRFDDANIKVYEQHSLSNDVMVDIEIETRAALLNDLGAEYFASLERAGLDEEHGRIELAATQPCKRKCLNIKNLSDAADKIISNLSQNLIWARKSLDKYGGASQAGSASGNGDVGIPRRYKSIDVGNQVYDFYGRHRKGWSWIIQGLDQYSRPGGLYIDTFVERTFAWGRKTTRQILRDWVGIVHVPLNGPDWFRSEQRINHYMYSEDFRKSLPYCRGLFTLSKYLKRSIEKYVDVPVDTLMYPTEDETALAWSPQAFLDNPAKALIQIGWFLRRLNAIYLLPRSDYKKVFLHLGRSYVDDMVQYERNLLKKNCRFFDFMERSVEVVNFLSNDDYDELLSCNVVFLHLYDSSANNTVTECMNRATPLLVNRIEAVEEYLGKDYPFYYESYDEAIEKVSDLNLVMETHEYLKHLPPDKLVTREDFCRRLIQSSIIKDLVDWEVRE